MNTKVATGIAVVAALLIAGWWYWSQMNPGMLPPDGMATTTPGAENENTDAATSEVGIVGTWRSNDDSRFVRQFNADGTVTDSYEGDASATVTGEWEVVDLAAVTMPAPVPENIEQVIRIQFPEEALFFAVTTLTDTELGMMYLGGNGVLSFTRVQ